MADFQVRIRRLRRYQRVPRVFLDRTNPLEVLTAEEIRERYRFRPQSIMLLVGTLNDAVAFPTKRSMPLPPLIAVLVALQFYATGAHHLLIASLHNVSRASIGRTIDRLTSALNDLLCRYIFFPCRQRLEEIQKEFYSIAGFPRVVGCVDGTHIRIKALTENEGDFVNRKGFHSINAQFRVLDLVAKWSGSVHDSRIFRESSLCRRFENGEIDGLLLGDSGYPCRSYLMTPYLNPQNLSQERFNAALVKTRVLVEQTFGIIKRRFPCLSYGICTSPAKACLRRATQLRSRKPQHVQHLVTTILTLADQTGVWTTMEVLTIGIT